MPSLHRHHPVRGSLADFLEHSEVLMRVQIRKISSELCLLRYSRRTCKIRQNGSNSRLAIDIDQPREPYTCVKSFPDPQNKAKRTLRNHRLAMNPLGIYPSTVALFSHHQMPELGRRVQRDVRDPCCSSSAYPLGLGQSTATEKTAYVSTHNLCTHRGRVKIHT